MPSPASSPNVTFHRGSVGAADRERLLGQRGCVAWFTGLSGSGKSTVARAVEAALAREGRLVYVLDGDNVRHGLCSDLGFSDRDRNENIRRISEVAALFVDAGAIVLTAFISPFRADRAQARGLIGADRFFEVFVDVPVEVCERRDPKKLYAKARRGEIRDFTGIDSPYEAPEAPDLVVRTAETTVEAAAGAVVEFLRGRGVLSPPPAGAATAGTTSGGA